MENPNISESTREKLEEAAVSVFMDQYAAMLDAGIDKKMEDCADMEFPPELDSRCRALIQQEYRKQRLKSYKKHTLRMLRSVAAVAIVLLSLCSVLFITVEAFRVPIMNFFVEKHDRHLELRGTSAEDEIATAFNPDNPLGTILSEDYILVELQNNWQEGMLAATYLSDTDSSVFFMIDPVISTMLVDDENAKSRDLRLIDYDTQILIEENIIRLYWLDAETEQTFTLCGIGIAEETMISIAEAIVMMFE